MKLTEVFDILNEKSSSYDPSFNSAKGFVMGSVQDWMELHGMTKENQKETVRKALEELKKTRAWQVADSMGLKFITSDRELNLGTLAFEQGLGMHDITKASAPWRKQMEKEGMFDIYVYNIYGNGQIRTYLRPKNKPTGRAGITRLKSPKPAMVIGNPVKSLAKTWENSLWEVTRKFKEKLDVVEKRLDQ